MDNNLWCDIGGLFQRDNSAPDDYMVDGIPHCAVCGEPKQAEIELLDQIILASVSCKCQLDAYARREAESKRRRFDWRMDREIEDGIRDGITSAEYYKHRLTDDDGRNKTISKTCNDYVTRWAAMKENNIGILFYGSVGTGKTYLACAIANELRARGISSYITNLTRVINKLQGYGNDRQAIINRLTRHDLLVIDDLGAERGTEYAAEQVQNVIDARYMTGKPTIITTNLEMTDFDNPPTTTQARIYDRVRGMCPITIKMAGKSRRKDKAHDRRELARKLLGGTT